MSVDIEGQVHAVLIDAREVRTNPFWQALPKSAEERNLIGRQVLVNLEEREVIHSTSLRREPRGQKAPEIRQGQETHARCKTGTTR